jgi:hypothetical protein
VGGRGGGGGEGGRDVCVWGWVGEGGVGGRRGGMRERGRERKEGGGLGAGWGGKGEGREENGGGWGVGVGVIFVNTKHATQTHDCALKCVHVRTMLMASAFRIIGVLCTYVMDVPMTARAERKTERKKKGIDRKIERPREADR